MSLINARIMQQSKNNYNEFILRRLDIEIFRAIYRIYTFTLPRINASYLLYTHHKSVKSYDSGSHVLFIIIFSRIPDRFFFTVLKIK